MIIIQNQLFFPSKLQFNLEKIGYFIKKKRNTLNPLVGSFYIFNRIGELYSYIAIYIYIL